MAIHRSLTALYNLLYFTEAAGLIIKTFRCHPYDVSVFFSDIMKKTKYHGKNMATHSYFDRTLV